jgi:hypothetical protein
MKKRALYVLYGKANPIIFEIYGDHPWRKALQMEPVVLEVLAPMLSAEEIACHSCRLVFGDLGIRKSHLDACVNEYPEDWKEAVLHLSQWLREISGLYQHRIRIRVIDALSPLGLWKQIRYGLRRFPAFIIDGQCTFAGWDAGRLESLIDQRLQALRCRESAIP